MGRDRPAGPGPTAQVDRETGQNGQNAPPFCSSVTCAWGAA